MPIEFAEGLLENDDFRVETDTNGDLIQEHKQTGAQFKFDSTKNTWVPVRANLDNAALGTALDANNNDINNASAIESASVSTTVASIGQVAAVAHPTSNQTFESGTSTKMAIDSVPIEDTDVLTVDTSTDEITVQKDGIYIISIEARWAGESGWSTGDKANLDVRINGLLSNNGDNPKVGTQSETVQNFFVDRLTQDDIITSTLFQTSGGSKQILGSVQETRIQILRAG